MADGSRPRSPWLEVISAMVVVLGATWLAWHIRLETRSAPVVPFQPTHWQPYGLATGPWAMQPLAWVDCPIPGRSEPIRLRVRRPQGQGPWAWILFLPGRSPDQEEMDWLVEHWVTHGYVVLECFLSKPQTEPVPVDLAKQFTPQPDDLIDQLAVLNRLIQNIPQILRQFSDFDGQVDPARLGLAGAGLSGHLPLLLGGARVFPTVHLSEDSIPVPQEKLLPVATSLEDGEGSHDDGYVLRNRRVQAVISLWSQFVSSRWIFEPHASATLEVPTLLVTSLREREPQPQVPSWQKVFFENAPPGGRYLLSTTRNLRPAHGPDGDAAAAAGQASRLATRHSRMTMLLRIGTTAFWDAYLKENEVALDFLRSDGIERCIGPHTRFEKK